MARKKESSFEVIVVLAIVAIVAVTGQVLIQYDLGEEKAELESDNSLTGFSISADAAPVVEFTDVAVKSISLNPGSPVLGEPFEIVVTLENKGTSALSTPFYVGLDITPMPTEDGQEYAPLRLEATSSEIIRPKGTVELSFYTSLHASEGPVRFLATADTTSKLYDSHMGNNQLSKTAVLAE